MSQYYNPSLGDKVGRIVTKDICTMYYETQGIVRADEHKKRDIRGKNPLLVCQYCFDRNFEIPGSGGRVNQKQKHTQEQQTKRKSLDKHTINGGSIERRS